MVFLPKVGNPINMKQFRGIVLTSCLGEWYMGCLVLIAQMQPLPPLYHQVAIVGYEPEQSTEIITGQIQLLCARATEWEYRLRVHILQGDVYKAFDTLQPSVVARAMEDAGWHPQIIASILEEDRYLKLFPCFEGVDRDDLEVPCTASVKQGGKEATLKWNLVMRWLFSQLIPSWQVRNFGG